MPQRQKRRAYQIQYSPEALEHLSVLTARDSATVLQKVEAKLRHEPAMSTRNRKLLRANEIAPWELRVGNLRVYYEIKEDDSEPGIVLVKAVGVKEHSVLKIGGEEIEL